MSSPRPYPSQSSSVGLHRCPTRFPPVSAILRTLHRRPSKERKWAKAHRVKAAGHEHEDGIHAVCLSLDDELDWTAFGVWLTMLLQARGEDVLRVKGLLNVGAEGPLLVNGVQHAVHPPEHLNTWPDEDRRSRIVFIGRGFDGPGLERSLAVFNAAVTS